jgi:AraC family transcriptional regulator
LIVDGVPYVRSHAPSRAVDAPLRSCLREARLASIVTADLPRNRTSARQAASRSWRDALRGAAGAGPAPTVHEGSVEVSCGGQRLLARWSSAKPATLTLSVDRRAPAEVRVHLRGTMEAGAVSFGPHLTARIDADDALARECVTRLFDLGRRTGEVSALFTDALLRTLALHVFTRYAPPAAESARYGDRLAAVLVRHLQAFIDARLDRRLSRTDLAGVAGYDVREFSTAFRNTLGMTPMQYVIERRLDRACLLIANTGRDLADIAISAGFSSQSHLTSTLKKRRGITPLRLRRQSARVIAAGSPR